MNPNNPAPANPNNEQTRLSQITGTIERITYQNDDNGYTIARLLPTKSKHGETVTIVGNLPSLAPGENLDLSGYWRSHAQYGKQFQVENYKVVLPATITGIQKYLGSGLIKGVGPKTSEKIVKKFGLDTLDILETDPDRLAEVPGLGKKKAEVIKHAWYEQRAIKEVMLFLQGQSISTALAVRIYKQYKDASISVVKNEPYRLAREVFGIGFKTADKIASSLGIAKDDPERLKAGIIYVLSEGTEEGHVYLPYDELVKRSSELLEAGVIQVEQALAMLIDERGVETETLSGLPAETIEATPQAVAATDDEWVRAVAEEQAEYEVAMPWENQSAVLSPQSSELGVYLPAMHHAEQGVDRNLRRLRDAAPNKDRLANFQATDFKLVFDYLANKDNLQLNEQQQEAVQMALTEKVSVLTGGPGTGKTTSMRALLRVLSLKKKRVILAAPTGRAAKRLSEATGAPATTIHRLLELRPGGKPSFDRERPLDVEMVIVDEASMLDVLLINNLLKAVPDGAHLLLVGDTDQLPSVGAGNVLGDVVSSGAIPVVRLQHVFRQGADSAIITNAHRINSGQMPQTSRAITDFFFFIEDEPEKCAELVVDLVSKRIPAKFGYHPVNDVQVLAPMHRSAVGVESINQRLQAILNPPADHKAERRWGSRLFRVGDKVMQLKNDYDKQVFNGDGGIVMAIDPENQMLQVKLEDSRLIDYDFNELDELTLAYCVSVHKSQGSEYPVVVLPLLTSHYPMLQRNLIYTAVTRARKIVVLVGSRRAMAIAIHNNRTSRRFTGLAARLSPG